LPEPATILESLLYRLSPKDFKGKQILITAGPTLEPIDPVRFIGNPSSGKMGYAVARAAARRGASVTLITGPTQLPDPLGVTPIMVQTAEEMARAVFEHRAGKDIIIKAAAVSDYAPSERATRKIKKSSREMVLYLHQTPDILKELGKCKQDQVLVGFAAETEHLKKNAQQKLTEKNLDIIVGNLVGTADSGFKADTNTATFFYQDGTIESLPSMKKETLAHVLLDRILERFSSTAGIS
jgi:phosphopantothenoylcysteine decarboxylase/phosphopantothenate--cysteine ligase